MFTLCFAVQIITYLIKRVNTVLVPHARNFVSFLARIRGIYAKNSTSRKNSHQDRRGASAQIRKKHNAADRTAITPHVSTQIQKIGARYILAYVFLRDFDLYRLDFSAILTPFEYNYLHFSIFCVLSYEPFITPSFSSASFAAALSAILMLLPSPSDILSSPMKHAQV